MIAWKCENHEEGVVWWKAPPNEPWCWACGQPGERRYPLTLPNGELAA